MGRIVEEGVGHLWGKGVLKILRRRIRWTDGGKFGIGLNSTANFEDRSEIKANVA